MTTKALLHPNQPLLSGRFDREAARGPAWLAQSLNRLVEHVRTLLPIDGVSFLIVDRERRNVHPVADWFASPELCEAITLGGERRYDPLRPGLAEFALERGRSLLLPRVEAWEAAPGLLESARAALGETQADRSWETFRTASVIACPVKTAMGRPLGVLVVASLDDEHPLKAPELRTVEVLADLAALAIERAELLDEEARRSRNELLLKRASEDVSGSLELEDVYQRIVHHAVRVTGARKALLTRLTPRANELSVAAAIDFSPGFASRRLGLDRGMLGHVARTREPYVSSSGDGETWDTSVTEPERIGSFMHVPIELGPRLFGVLTVADEQVDRFARDELELLVKLARSSAAGIANAIDFDRERRIARALTLGFVPESLPEVQGYESGLLYAPAANEPTGGDVYGAWSLPGEGIALLVGDVAGKGVETAALSAMVRFFIEARGWDSTSPSTVLAQTNDMLLGRLPRDTFVTAFFGILGPGRLRYCSAGHLPPFLVRGGTATELESRGMPLGIERDHPYRDSELELQPDDVVFAYTDGLMEARRGGEVYGMDRLAKLVASLSGELGPQELVKGVHEEVARWANGLTDDAVALALRRRSA